MAYGAMNHKQVLEMFAKSRTDVRLAESDGISTSMLEAMTMGAIPVQTSKAFCDEGFGDSGADARHVTVSLVKKATQQDLGLVRDPAGAEAVKLNK